MRVFFAAAVVALALCGPAQAQRLSNLTGQKLAEMCAGRDARMVEACTAYIDGIADSSAFYQRLRPADGSKGAALPGYICVPGSITGIQLREAFVQWFRKHAGDARRQASGVVLRALDETYLCPGEQPHVPKTE
jgi:hypothetical protein